MKNKPMDPQKHSGSQLAFSLFYSMIPVIGFLLVEGIWGLEAGVIAGVILGIIEITWIYYKEKRWDLFAICSALLIVAMGAISWISKDRTFVLLKPAIIEGIFAFILLGSSLIKKPFMMVIANKQFGPNAFGPIQVDYFNGLNFRVGILFLIHTFMTIYSALWYQEAWIYVKGVVFYLLFAVFLVAEVFYSRFVMRKKMEALQMQQVFLEQQQSAIKKMRHARREK